MRDQKTRDEKERARNDPSASSDWFLVGNVDELRRNLDRVKNEVDKGRIQTKISFLEKEWLT